jgi:hypothetical protein
LQLGTGEVLRVVDGIADPEMHSRIAADANYMRIDPVSSREQYRWMERFIQMLEEGELRDKLLGAIDGKGAFRRFKDVLMAHGPERERWFAFRSERLRVFMKAWLSAHALSAVARPVWAVPPPSAAGAGPASGVPASGPAASVEPRRQRSSEVLRRKLRDLGEGLGSRDLEKVIAFTEFIKARRAARAFAKHEQEGEAPPESENGEIRGENDNE